MGKPGFASTGGYDALPIDARGSHDVRKLPAARARIFPTGSPVIIGSALRLGSARVAATLADALATGPIVSGFSAIDQGGPDQQRRDHATQHGGAATRAFSPLRYRCVHSPHHPHRAHRHKG
jgi:hypothetical protein